MSAKTSFMCHGILELSPLASPQDYCLTIEAEATCVAFPAVGT